jgi:hypothetical protein
MKLARALLCVECDEVFEASGSGTCTSCGCSVSYPVERAVNRAAPTIPTLRRYSPHYAGTHLHRPTHHIYVGGRRK